MSRDAGQAEQISRLLSQHFGVPIGVSRQRTRGHEPFWQVSWIDGPIETLVRSQIRVLQEHHADLQVGQCCFTRQLSPAAWAHALLEIPPEPDISAQELLHWAELLVHDCAWPGRFSEPGKRLAAAELQRRTGGDVQLMARLLAARYAATASADLGTGLPGRAAWAASPIAAWPRRGREARR